MLIFKISEKGQGLVFLPYFENDFSRKTFHMLDFINWPYSLSDCLFFSWYWAICVFWLFVNPTVTSWTLKFSFLIIPFRYTTKKSRQKLKYLENEKSFWRKKNAFFIVFTGLSVAKNCLRPESGLLKYLQMTHCFFQKLKTKLFLILNSITIEICFFP